MNAPSNAPGQTFFTKTVAVAAGQVLTIPKDFINDADFQAKLVAVAYPANQKFTDFTKYTTPGATAGLREDFRGDKTGADIKVKFPPTNTVVSP